MPPERVAKVGGRFSVLPGETFSLFFAVPHPMHDCANQKATEGRFFRRLIFVRFALSYYSRIVFNVR